jgi:hypothetical protein
MKVRSAFAVLALSLASGAAYAGGTAAIPEPGTIELLAISAVVGIAAPIRNRRK